MMGVVAGNVPPGSAVSCIMQARQSVLAAHPGHLGGRKPKLHYSEQDPSKRPGAHSAYADPDLFRRFMDDVGLPDYDVMLECKAKELALLRLREELCDDDPILEGVL